MATNNTVQYTITAKDQASAVFAGVATKVKGSAANLEKGFQSLSKTASAGMGALSGDFSKLGDVIGGIGGPAAAMGAAVVGALGSMITKTMEASEGFRKLSERTGASVEFLSGFTQAADDMFISAETVSASLTIFAKKLGGAEDAMDGSGVSAGAFAKKLQEIGINSDNVEEALGQVADRFAGMKDGTEKTALAVQLFGKQGVELIPVLNKGRDGIREMTAAAKEMGLVLTTETMEAVTRLKQVLDNLGDRAEGAALNMGSGLVKAAADAGEAFLKFDDQQRVMWQRADADNWLGLTLRVYKQFTEVNGKMVKTLSVSNQALREQGEWALKDSSAIHDVARATVDMGTAMENVDGPTRTVTQLADEMGEAFRIATIKEYDAKAAAEELAAKQDALADATNNVNSAFNNTPKAMDSAEKAMLLFDVATGKTTLAQFEQRQAMEAIRSALDQGIIKYPEAAKALIGLRDGSIESGKGFDIAGAAARPFIAELKDIKEKSDLIKPKRVQIDVKSRWDNYEETKAKYDSVRSKTETVTVNYTSNGTTSNGSPPPNPAAGDYGLPVPPGPGGGYTPPPYDDSWNPGGGNGGPYGPSGAGGEKTAKSSTFNVNNPSIIINSVSGAAIAQQIARQNMNVARRARAKAALMG